VRRIARSVGRSNGSPALPQRSIELKGPARGLELLVALHSIAKLLNVPPA
jgi:hypothetical protein